MAEGGLRYVLVGWGWMGVSGAGHSFWYSPFRF